MISILITSIIQVMIVSYEPWARFFKLTTIPIQDIGILLLLTIPVIVVMEIFKKIIKDH